MSKRIEEKQSELSLAKIEHNELEEGIQHYTKLKEKEQIEHYKQQFENNIQCFNYYTFL